MFKGQSVQGRFFLFIVPLLLGVLVLATGIHAVWELNSDREEIRKRALLMAELLEHQVGAPLVTGDHRAAESAVEQISRDAEVVLVRVEDRQGRVVHERSRQVLSVIEVSVPVEVTGEEMGKVVLALDRKRAWEKLRGTLAYSVVLGAGLLIILLAGIHVALRRRVVEPLTRLLEVTRAAGATLDLKKLLALLAEKTAQACRVERCTIFLLEGEQVIPVTSRFADGHRDEEMWEAFKALRSYKVEEIPVLAETCRGRQPVVVPAGSELIPADWRETFGMKSLLAVPLVASGRVIGAVHLDYTDVSRSFTQDQIHLASTIAGQAALAIENARLFKQERERRQQLEAARAVTEEITRELDLTALLGLINRRAAELVGAVSGAIYLWDEEAQILSPRAWYGLGEWMKEVRLKLGEGITGAVAQRREGMIVNDYRVSPYASPLFLERSGITAVIAEPLFYRDRFLGVITVNNEGTGRLFTQEDRELLAIFADQAAIAIANARLFAERESQAEVLAATNRSLKEAAGRLEAKNQELEAFVYTVTHDLRAPLVALQGMASMLAEAKGVQLDAEGRHYLDRLVANTAHMEELIRNLLEFSRVGRMAKAPVAVTVAEVVDGLLLQWGDLTRERGVKVVCRDLPVLWGERTRIEQVYQNLLGNALKFLGADNPAPMIEVGAEDRGEEWECYVKDNGIGIDPAYHGKVFELFQRLREVEAEGTGIGLAIAKKIVDRAGGTMWIESEAGKGATFRFTWPKGVREESERDHG